MRSAAGKGATVLNRSVKSHVDPRMKGLKRSIGRRGVTYTATNTILVVIGPRFAFIDPESGLVPSAFAYSVEFGDHNSPPRPFARPGMEAVRGEVVATVGRNLGPAIEREAAKLRRRR